MLDRSSAERGFWRHKRAVRIVLIPYISDNENGPNAVVRPHYLSYVLRHERISQSHWSLQMVRYPLSGLFALAGIQLAWSLYQTDPILRSDGLPVSDLLVLHEELSAWRPYFTQSLAGSALPPVRDWLALTAMFYAVRY